MAATTARLLRLLTLLQARSVWSSQELADELGITTRSVRRDVERLRDLGYPVRASRGVGGGYQLGAGRALPPLLLDEREAVALRLAAGGAVAGIGEAAVRTMVKLDQVLPAAARAQVAAVHEATTTLDTSVPSVDPDDLLTVSRSVRESTQIRFDYATASGVGSQRRAEPYHLVVSGSRWYLVAFDLDRDDWRSFRLDRMSEVRASTFTFRPRAAPDPATYIHEATTQRWAVAARLRVAIAADDLRRRVSRWAQVVDLGDGTSELRVSADSFDDIAAWLMRFDAPFEVIEPDELKAAFGRLSQRARALAN
ncbi:YafY family protein [Branchiibius sp. NY16-3462-2]|uniref:helix-turn-helix transcriptional regulator n=1 Tax=Branchiibius sp. NY16-3462-2 TaxID=1807500 RepID=UPI000799B9B9|nr:WYL domain-containing protein [Branchiibius sp. NY16-3462-2]KYH43489.1 transcriptional regulator [Branchiibius sp. NY16-3462-2]